MVRQIDQGLDGLRIKAEMMGDAIDKQQEGMKGLEVEIKKAHQGLSTSNARLKKVLYQVKFFLFEKMAKPFYSTEHQINFLWM